MEDLLRISKLIRKYQTFFLAATFGVTFAVLVFSYTVPRKYQADTTVFIEKSIINELVKGLAVTGSLEDRIRVIKHALLSRDIISKALGKIDYSSHEYDENEMQSLVSDLQKRTDISVKEREMLFTVSFIDKDPVFARDYVNALVTTYVDENLSGKREETYGANRFLDEQLNFFKGELENAENRIIEFRKKNDIFLSANESSLLVDLQKYQQSIDELDIEMATAHSRLKSLQQQLKTIEPTVAFISERQKANQLLAIERKIDELLLSFTEKYPEVVRLRFEAEKLRSDLASSNKPEQNTQVSSEMTTVNPIYQDTKQKIIETQTEIGALAGKRQLLVNLLNERKGELQNAPENRKQLNVLVQERDSFKRIYEDLLLRKGQSQVSKQMEIGDKTTTFRIIDPAILPRSPIFPNMQKMILLALAAGLGAGLAAVVLYERVKGSVTDVRQLEPLGVEVLTVIPRMYDAVDLEKCRRSRLVLYGGSLSYVVGIVGLLLFETMIRV